MQAQTVGLGSSFASRKQPCNMTIATPARMQLASLSTGLRGFLAGRLMGRAPVSRQHQLRQLCIQPIPSRLHPAATPTDVEEITSTRNSGSTSTSTSIASQNPWPKGELPKTFEAASSEPRIYAWWESGGYFRPQENAQGLPYVIPMPPPNVTGKLHMGHAMFATIQDVMIRTARMRGRKTLWLPGTDHAGIATQSVVEKMLASEGKPGRLELGREAFNERVWAWKAEYGGSINNQLRRLGASCDWGRERFTLDEGLSSAVVEAFVRLEEKGLIYRGSYMVNWSPTLRTAVSDLEVDYVEEPGFMYYFRYPIADSPEGAFLPIATTRPETILGDTAVAVHPEDPRYKHLVGRECVVPMVGRRIKVLADEYVDREFGTGALKITPGHDPNDYEIGKRFNLETINIMNKDATLNAAAGKFAGMDRFEARKALWADIEAQGLAIKRENYTIRAPRSQRSGEIIEPLISDQWFVRMEPLAKPALAAVADGSIRIMPERFEKIYNNWLENIKDWCISRQLWWGHRIPVWYVFPNAAAAQASPTGDSDVYVVARNETEAYEKARAAHPDMAATLALVQDQDVLDTWFSSGLWPFSTLGWPNTEAPDLKHFYPTQVLETGHDILFFWVSRMIMMGIEFTGKPPFSLVFLHGLVRDEKGRKVCVGDCAWTGAGQDLNLSLDRITGNRNFTNKLWNAGKFILFQMDRAKAAGSEEAGLALNEQLAQADFSTPQALQALPLAERWIVSRVHQVVDEVTERHDKYDFNPAGIATYNFFWDEFADWFIESSKSRPSGSPQAQQSLAVAVYVFDRILKLMHPFMPYVTEELWQALPHKGEALIVAPWPDMGLPVCSTSISHWGALQGIVYAIRNARAEYNVETGKKIGGSVIVEDANERASLEAELPVISLLARMDPSQLGVLPAVPESTPAQGSGGAQPNVSLVVKDGIQVLLPMAGLFDAEKELGRLNKQRTKLQKDYDGVTARLSNTKFLEKASQAVVAEAKAQQEEAAEKLAMIDAKVSQVKALKSQ
ncbi:tRNA synthetases class I-domain-containing protein [Dunaliella salina]|uniref:valine--tRNA ligase n=1 Tax=Dunaliella salina TaxID=3046 RepID=A0ABQ7G0D9_DUNSA|nr:tRNA synthetases class I-domain-containing protein [Dunaliella salina]|eukprot:KAF5828074.1 tRNA synthetases class I-domain-containing protein [Dunaliella salina]